MKKQSKLDLREKISQNRIEKIKKAEIKKEHELEKLQLNKHAYIFVKQENNNKKYAEEYIKNHDSL